MSKYEDDVMELIERVVENSNHNVVKPFGRGAMPKGQMLDAKSAKTGMFLDRINKMAEVQNLLRDRLNICNGSEGVITISLQEAPPCANCSRFDHIELDCPIMAIQGKACSDKVHQEDRLNSHDQIFRVHTLTIIRPLFSIILRRMHDFGGTTINPILHHKMVSNNNNNPMRIKDNRLSSHRLNCKPTRKLYARLRRHPTRCSVQSRN